MLFYFRFYFIKFFSYFIQYFIYLLFYVIFLFFYVVLFVILYFNSFYTLYLFLNLILFYFILFHFVSIIFHFILFDLNRDMTQARLTFIYATALMISGFTTLVGTFVLNKDSKSCPPHTESYKRSNSPTLTADLAERSAEDTSKDMNIFE